MYWSNVIGECILSKALLNLPCSDILINEILETEKFSKQKRSVSIKQIRYQKVSYCLIFRHLSILQMNKSVIMFLNTTIVNS